MPHDDKPGSSKPSSPSHRQSSAPSSIKGARGEVRAPKQPSGDGEPGQALADSVGESDDRASFDGRRLGKRLDELRFALSTLMERQGLTSAESTGRDELAATYRKEIIEIEQRFEQALEAQVARQAIEKKRAGRFDLREAARLICADGESGSEEEMVEKLQRAAWRGNLAVYPPNQSIRVDPEDLRVRDGGGSGYRSVLFHEAYWDELNRWLDSPCQERETSPRSMSKFRFADPAGQANATHHMPGEVVDRPELGSVMPTDDEIMTIYRKHGSERKAADAIGMSRSTFQRRLRSARASGEATGAASAVKPASRSTEKLNAHDPFGIRSKR